MSFSDVVAIGRTLVADKKGVTAIEYGVIAALIIAVCIGTIALIGPKLNTAFQTVNTGLGT